MKFNKPLLITSLVAILASPALLAGDDTNGTGEGGGTQGTSVGDTQTATITIPEVSMIDVTNTVTATLTAPTEAGDNFTKTPVSETPKYAISANIAAASPTQTRKIVATSTDIPTGWKVYISMGAPDGTSATTNEQVLTSTATTVDLVTGIKNVAKHDVPMTISVGPEDANTMPSHSGGGTTDATIVYTITAGT